MSRRLHSVLPRLARLAAPRAELSLAPAVPRHFASLARAAPLAGVTPALADSLVPASVRALNVCQVRLAVKRGQRPRACRVRHKC